MSRVKVFKNERDKKNIQKTNVVPDGEATFLVWGVEYVEFESGPGNYSVAIIKRDDGSVETVIPEHIKFL